MNLKKVCFSHLQELHKQLEEALQDGEIWEMQLKDTEYELDGSRDRVQQQANEILHKASENNVMTKLHFLQHIALHHSSCCVRVFLERLQFCDSLAEMDLTLFCLNLHLNST